MRLLDLSVSRFRVAKQKINFHILRNERKRGETCYSASNTI